MATERSAGRGPRFIIAALVAMVVLGACSSAESVIADDRRPVILDYSPTVSDLGALAFLASHDDLRLVGVTLPGTGESHCGPGVEHTRGVLERIGLPDVPVACGPEEPLTGWNAFPSSWRLDADEIDLPVADPNEKRAAPELIRDLVRAEAAPVEIVAVGPLTNIAVALEANPSLADQLGGITIMGGALDVAGNVLRNDVAEWNLWVDPTAAATVLASGAHVTLVPLDATNALPTSRIFYAALEQAAGTPASDLVLEAWRNRPEWYENPDGFFYFWDELAAAVMVDDSLVEFETAHLVVDDDQRENKGWTRRDPDGTQVRVAISADRLAFETLFLETITGGRGSLGYLEATPDEISYFDALALIQAESTAGTDELFDRTAGDMGLSGINSEEEFLTVLAAALPEALDVLANQASGIKSLDPPQLLESHHHHLLAAWNGTLSMRDDLVEQFTESTDTAIFDPAFSPIDEACRSLQAEADIRVLNIDLACNP